MSDASRRAGDAGRHRPACRLGAGGTLVATLLCATTVSLPIRAGSTAAAPATTVSTEVDPSVERCAYDPSSDVPNPLGMRAYVSVRREGEDSVFVYARLPALVGSAAEPATLAVRRTLVVRGLSIAEARAWLRTRDAVFEELLGYPLDGGYAAIDELLVCR